MSLFGTNEKLKPISTFAGSTQVNVASSNKELPQPNVIDISLITCPKCRNIPSLSISSTFDKINLTCFNCQYKEQFTVKEYLSNLNNTKDEEKHFCQFIISHQDKEASNFCVHCQQWLCTECMNLHSQIKLTKSHILVKRKIIIESRCEKHKERSYEFYCQQDHKHLCTLCYEEHRNHNAILLNKFTDNKNLITIKDNFIKAKSQLKEFNEKVKEKIELFKLKIKEIEEAYEIRKENSNNLIKLIQVILDNSMLDVDNYTLFQNIKTFTNFNFDRDNFERQIQSLNEMISYLKHNSIIFLNQNQNQNNLFVRNNIYNNFNQLY